MTSEHAYAPATAAGGNGTGVMALPLFQDTNTHLLVQEFEYLEPRSVQDAVAMLAEHGELARPIAGGTDILVQMKMERREPAYLVSLARIPTLRRISEAYGLELGATATIRAVARHPGVRERYAALAESCSAFSTVQIMVMGTIGGNLCNASPAADTAPALLALDARARLVSTAGTREAALGAFFTGPGRTVLAPGELLESVHLPAPAVPAGSAFLKVARVAADIAKVCVAVSLEREGERVRACRIALGSVAPTPRRAPRAEVVLSGERLSSAAIDDAVRLAREEIQPISDVRSTADYRRQVAGVLVADALRLAWRRAGGEEVA
jgi:carbon-monoxide dehydrogenase medium subunit